MIMSMHVGKFVFRSVGVVLVISSGSRVFQWAVVERGSWRGVSLSQLCDSVLD